MHRYMTDTGDQTGLYFAFDRKVSNLTWNLLQQLFVAWRICSRRWPYRFWRPSKNDIVTTWSQRPRWHSNQQLVSNIIQFWVLFGGNRLAKSRASKAGLGCLFHGLLQWTSRKHHVSRKLQILATLASRRSNCMKRRVGAVLVRDNRVIATG